MPKKCRFSVCLWLICHTFSLLHDLANDGHPFIFKSVFPLLGLHQRAYTAQTRVQKNRASLKKGEGLLGPHKSFAKLHGVFHVLFGKLFYFAAFHQLLQNGVDFIQQFLVALF